MSIFAEVQRRTKLIGSYLDKFTLEERLAGYIESEELEEDVGILIGEYSCNRQPIPPLEQLKSKAIMQKREWLGRLVVCELEGHQFIETADGENGTSELDCGRCGMKHHCQW